MKVITVSNQKGGVGKTTFAFHLVWYLWANGHRVLAIDLDPQGNLTDLLIGETEEYDGSHVMRIFSNETPEPLAVKDNLFLLPSDIRLSEEETDIRLSKYYSLRRYVEKLKELDFVIIDTPPNLGLFTVNSFIASSDIVVPVHPSRHSLLALRTLLDTVEGLKENIRQEMADVKAIIISRVKPNTNLGKDVVAYLKENYSDYLVEPPISDTVKIEYALRERIPVFEKYPDTTAAKKYEETIFNTMKKLTGGDR